MAKQLKAARISSASSQSGWPTDAAAIEAAVAEFGGIELDADHTGRQWAFVNAAGRMTDDVAYPTPATLYSNGEKLTGTAGHSEAFGDVCYVKFADGKFCKAKGDAAATANTLLALAMGTYAGEGAGVYLVRGLAANAAWTWVAGPIYLSPATAGAMTQAPPTTGQFARVVGWAITATLIYFAPDTASVEVA